MKLKQGNQDKIGWGFFFFRYLPHIYHAKFMVEKKAQTIDILTFDQSKSNIIVYQFSILHFYLHSPVVCLIVCEQDKENDKLKYCFP